MTFFVWLLIPAGIALIVYTKHVGDFTGRIIFAESFFGMGGTYTFIKLFGIFIIFLSLAWNFGGMKEFVGDGPKILFLETEKSKGTGAGP